LAPQTVTFPPPLCHPQKKNSGACRHCKEIPLISDLNLSKLSFFRALNNLRFIYYLNFNSVSECQKCMTLCVFLHRRRSRGWGITPHILVRGASIKSSPNVDAYSRVFDQINTPQLFWVYIIFVQLFVTHLLAKKN
jgi:hypothetical protein